MSYANPNGLGGRPSFFGNTIGRKGIYDLRND
jgi:hypothetical protein